MPLLGRRRPLMRAAMVGGVGYAAGKHRARKQEEEAGQEEAYAQDAPPEPDPAPAPASGIQSDQVQQLKDLKGLLDEGVLTQDEFDQQKQKILNG